MGDGGDAVRAGAAGLASGGRACARGREQGRFAGGVRAGDEMTWAGVRATQWRRVFRLAERIERFAIRFRTWAHNRHIAAHVETMRVRRRGERDE